MNDPAAEPDLLPQARAGCRFTLIHDLPADSWLEARRICDDALLGATALC
ncbi:hypothetical protein [Dyella flagellata]|nr:hypothetical protein [Dyella flagellata]